MIRLSREQIVYSFSRHHAPVLTIDPGTDLCFETWDARTGTIRSERDLFDRPHPRGPNPATGPVFVRGAEAGDALVVEIHDVRVANTGFTGLRPKLGVLGHLVGDHRTKLMEIRGGEVRFNERVRFPVRPMIGVIGTAPVEAEVGNMHPGPHGGNMDNNDVRAGATVYLPVFVPGALFALGDIHASMGDGEISITALEVCGEAAVRVNLAKGEAITRPWIELEGSWITTGDGPTIADAIRVAAEEMARLLQRRLRLTVEEAYMLLSIRGDMKVSQCCEPAMIAATARAVMPVL